jgi:RNA polymerase primary sigma factor
MRLPNGGDVPLREETSVGQDALSAYLREIAHVQLLTAEEERALGRAVRRGEMALQSRQKLALSPAQEAQLSRLVWEGQEAERKLVQANLRLVVSVAKRYMHCGLPFADLIQEGNVGLVKAARKFDHRLYYRFSTYATCWIRQAISRAVAEHSHTLRLPAHFAELTHQVRETSRRLQQQWEREPCLDEIALETGAFSAEERAKIALLWQEQCPLPVLWEKRLDKVRERVRLVLTSMLDPVSLEAPLGLEGNSSLMEILHAGEPGPAEEVLARLLGESLRAAMEILSPREREVLRCRFGLADAEVLTLEEIGRQLGVTRERVRQIEQRALGKLGLERQMLACYLA